MTDNFKQMKRLMDFSDENRFYYLQILARSKDGNSKATKVVKNYYITNEEYLDEREEQIKDLCRFFSARAYLRLNRRSYEKVAYENLKQIANSLSYRQYEFVRKSYSKACGRTNDEPNRIWILDFDEKDYNSIDELQVELANCKMYVRTLQTEIQKDYKIIGEVNTPGGVHLLTNPFNKKEFSDKYNSVDIHTDNPTVLFAPDFD